VLCVRSFILISLRSRLPALPLSSIAFTSLVRRLVASTSSLRFRSHRIPSLVARDATRRDANHDRGRWTVDHSVIWSFGRSFGRSLGRSLGRSVTSSFDSVGRPSLPRPPFARASSSPALDRRRRRRPPSSSSTRANERTNERGRQSDAERRRARYDYGRTTRRRRTRHRRNDRTNTSEDDTERR